MGQVEAGLAFLVGGLLFGFLEWKKQFFSRGSTWYDALPDLKKVYMAICGLFVLIGLALLIAALVAGPN